MYLTTTTSLPMEVVTIAKPLQKERCVSEGTARDTSANKEQKEMGKLKSSEKECTVGSR